MSGVVTGWPGVLCVLAVCSGVDRDRVRGESSTASVPVGDGWSAFSFVIFGVDVGVEGSCEAVSRCLRLCLLEWWCLRRFFSLRRYFLCFLYLRRWRRRYESWLDIEFVLEKDELHDDEEGDERVSLAESSGFSGFVSVSSLSFEGVICFLCRSLCRWR